MIITKYDTICAICGKPKECTHHLIYGYGKHELCDEDKLTIPMCHRCHNLAVKPQCKIHGNPLAEALSKICGQLAFEKGAVAMGYTEDEAREHFIERYGRSYL